MQTTKNPRPFEVVELPLRPERDDRSVSASRFVEVLVCGPLRMRSVPHGFTLRSGGFGERGSRREDERLLTEALGQASYARMNQVHGSDVRSLDAVPPEAPTCDGLVTASPGLGLVVSSADCVPILFWDEGTNSVAAVHAGWRGTLAYAARAAVAELESQRSTNAHELHVALGPAIRACCFEVGDEVVSAFEDSGRDLTRIARRGERAARAHLNLIEDNRIQLIESGIPDGQIHDSECCTVCENDRFYSFRKEGMGVGRVLAMIAPRP